MIWWYFRFINNDLASELKEFCFIRLVKFISNSCMLIISHFPDTLHIILNRKPSIKPSISNKRRNSSVKKNSTKIFYFWDNLIQTNSFSILSIGIISKVIKNRLKQFCIITIIQWNLGVNQLTIKDPNLLNLWID